MKADILAFGSHPDDVELSCAGTLLRHIADGKKVVIVDLTKGELGTRGTKAIREKEAAVATEILGVAARENLGLADGFFENNKQHQREVMEMIRKYQPEIVITNAEHDRHPDHGRACRLVTDSCFLAGLAKAETMIDSKPQLPWRPKAVYHYMQDRYIRPDIIVDVTDFMEKKMESVKAYSSQFYDPASSEPGTYISSENFLESIYARARELGKVIGVKYGEGFTASRIPGVNDLFDLI